MLYLLFSLGAQRYAVPATRVVEVLPLVEVRQIPQSSAGVAGLFNYRGQLVPLIDMCELVVGLPAIPWLSTRILLVRDCGERLYGLIVERATRTREYDPGSFVSSGIVSGAAPYLGPVASDGEGMLQCIELDELLSKNQLNRLFGREAGTSASGAEVAHAANSD